MYHYWWCLLPGNQALQNEVAHLNLSTLIHEIVHSISISMSKVNLQFYRDVHEKPRKRDNLCETKHEI